MYGGMKTTGLPRFARKDKIVSHCWFSKELKEKSVSLNKIWIY